MKKILITTLLLIYQLNCYSQHLNLKISGKNSFETASIDSLSYNTIHQNLNSIQNTVTKLNQKLIKKGFLESHLIEITKINDSAYHAKLNLQNQINYITIHSDHNNLLDKTIIPKLKNNSITLRYTETDDFIKTTLKNLEKKGYPLSKLKLLNTKANNDTLYTNLNITFDQQKTINDIVIKTEDKTADLFPASHLHQINKKYKNKNLTKEIINELYLDFQKFNYLDQIKYPEILFLKDSTKVYIYLEKRKTNTFDGFIGFNNNEKNKLKVNGYLDLNLENAIKYGERISIFWKNDGNQQTTFKANLEIPYLFKTPLALKTELAIFKQDSTFQNTKTGINIGYLFNYNTKFYLGYSATRSSDIQNTNNAIASDYKNSFFTMNFEYLKKSQLITSETKTSIKIKTGIGSRNLLIENPDLTINKQFFVESEITYVFCINKKNNIILRNQVYFLQSNNYLNSELYRFGGVNSIRGFEENSLQASKYSTLLSEYNHIVNSNLKTHIFLDYSILKNNKSEKIFAIGSGISIINKNNSLKLIIANGNENIQSIKLSKTIMHISYNVKF